MRPWMLAAVANHRSAGLIEALALRDVSEQVALAQHLSECALKYDHASHYGAVAESIECRRP